MTEGEVQAGQKWFVGFGTRGKAYIEGRVTVTEVRGEMVRFRLDEPSRDYRSVVGGQMSVREFRKSGRREL